MRKATISLLLVGFMVLVLWPPVVSAQAAGSADRTAQEPGPQAETAQAQDLQSGGGQTETEAVQDEATIDASDLPEVDSTTTDEQEAALRLVEEILAEQKQLLSGQNFVYQAGGRRDPFRSLLALRQHEIAAPELRPPGLPGFLINEVDLLAVASYQGRWQALLRGTDQRTYFTQVGGVLYDGRVVEISGDEVVFEQEVEDLLGARSTRQVIKRLTTGNQE